jgi:hypothetical protein
MLLLIAVALRIIGVQFSLRSIYGCHDYHVFCCATTSKRRELLFAAERQFYGMLLGG